jgi:hypothetical protein
MDAPELAGSQARMPLPPHEQRYACQMAKRLRRAPVEPPAMDVHDGLTEPRCFGSAPPSRNTSNAPSFVDNARWRSDVLHDRVERNSSCNTLKLAFIRFDDGAHGGHRNLVFRTEWMVY